MCKIHISCAENTPTTHIFNYRTIDINSQHPYLLGFDSNLIPNFNILVFQPYPGEDSEYLEESGRFACNSASSLGNTPNIREIHSDWSYFLQDTAGFTANTEYIDHCQIWKEKPEKLGKSTFCFLGFTTDTEYIDYSPDSERKTRIIGKIIKRSSEMAKIAIPAQEISENLEKSL